MWLIVLATALVCASGQHVKTANYGVKGGYGGHGQGYQYTAGENLHKLFGSNNTQQQNGYAGYGGFGGNPNYGPPQPEVGVCYVEVPTVSLARDPAHVPMGNGSRPDLSRIRTCCKGYIRNIHNSLICDPVCSEDCVNALCTAPETCTCFPDHVKNAAGFCVATCPIGCQNGYCAGGECLCRDGYRLDVNSKYCLPNCKDNCGGIGNCTAPNTCNCKSGYTSTPDGSCKPHCDKPCQNGDCVAPNECRCRPGYKDQQGLCVPHCAQDCGPNSRCVSPNVCSSPTTSPHHIPNQPYNPTNPSTPQSPYNQQYPSNYPQLPSNYSSSHPNFTDSQRPYYPYNQPDYSHGNQRPDNPGHNTAYYPTDNHNQPPYNITSDSQVKPNYPYNPTNQSAYGPHGNNPNFTLIYGPNGPLNQTNNYPYGPYQPYNPSDPNSHNPSQRPTNQTYYPYYPDSSIQIGPPSNPNQPGYYPGNPNQPSYYPGNPNQPGYNGSQSNQVGYQPGQPNQPSYHPGQSNQPSYYPGQPNQPGYPNQPNQPGYHPNQPNQPGYHPNQPNQPGYHPNQPNQPGYQPTQSGTIQSNSSNPYLPYYTINQAPNYGYQEQSENVDLIPQCAQPCINGVCVEGNRCSCNPGYVKDNSDPTESRCIPYCAGGCHNGVCSAPNFCICNVGYRKEQGVKGRAGCVKRIR